MTNEIIGIIVLYLIFNICLFLTFFLDTKTGFAFFFKEYGTKQTILFISLILLFGLPMAVLVLPLVLISKVKEVINACKK